MPLSSFFDSEYPDVCYLSTILSKGKVRILSKNHLNTCRDHSLGRPKSRDALLYSGSSQFLRIAMTQ